MSPATNFADYIEQNVRLAILKAIGGQIDGTLNETLIKRALEVDGHRKNIPYIRNQMRFLERDALAIRVIEADDKLVGVLLPLGRDHLERRVRLEGVEPPEDGT